MTAHSSHDDLLLRYRIGQRVVHALLASSFLVLLITGLALIVPFMQPLAQNGTSRILHRVAAVLFMAVPVVYLVVDWRGALELLKESFTYDRDDLEWGKRSYRYFFGHAVDMPPQGRLNAGQKVHHAGVVIFSALVVASGLALWFGKGLTRSQRIIRRRADARHIHVRTHNPARRPPLLHVRVQGPFFHDNRVRSAGRRRNRASEVGRRNEGRSGILSAAHFSRPKSIPTTDPPKHHS